MTDTTVCNVPIYEVPAPEYISPVADKVFFEDGETLQYKYDQNTVVKVRKNVTVNMIEDLTPSCFFQRHPDMTYSLTVNIPKHVTARLFDPTRKYPKPFTSSSTVFDANGEMQEPEIQNSDTTIARALYKVTESYSLEPITESVEIGDYILVFSMKDLEFESWSDGTRDPVIIPYRINAPILYYTTEIPQLISSIDYTGSVINCKWEEPVPSKYVITGDTFATEVGTYTVLVSPPEGKHFEDSTDTSVTRTWQVKSTIHYYSTDVPQLLSPITYTGSEVQTDWETPLPEGLTVTSGSLSATNEDTYTVTVSVPAGYVFEDTGEPTVTRTWEVARMKLVNEAGCLFDPDNGNLVETVDDKYYDPGDYSAEKGHYTPICMICEAPPDLLTDYVWKIDMNITPDNITYRSESDIYIFTAQDINEDTDEFTCANEQTLWRQGIFVPPPSSIEEIDIDLPMIVIVGYAILPSGTWEGDITMQMTFSCTHKTTGFLTVFKTNTGAVNINHKGIG